MNTDTGALPLVNDTSTAVFCAGLSMAARVQRLSFTVNVALAIASQLALLDYGVVVLPIRLPRTSDS